MEGIFNPLVTILDYKKEYRNSENPFNVSGIHKASYNTDSPSEDFLLHDYVGFFLIPNKQRLFCYQRPFFSIIFENAQVTSECYI